jgi:uncharacterized protein (TIGR03086 family)
VDPLEALSRAAATYARALETVMADQWDQLSACPGWTIKELADHVLGGNRFSVALLAGHSAEDAYRAAFAGGFEGEPLEEFDVSAAMQHTAFASTVSLDDVVPHPVGAISAGAFLGFRVGDLLLHAWDVTRSVGGDAPLDDELAAWVWNSPQPFRDEFRTPGQFGTGPSGLVPEDASPAEKVLDASGRRV